VRWRAAIAVALLMAACSRDPIAVSAGPECEVRFAAPVGFAPLDPLEVDYPDHVGVRLGFRDPDRREFHVFAGIPGEFGEGMADAGDLRMSEGRTGALLGDATVWVLTWRESDVCDPRAVLGSGFSRRSFLEMLAEAGLRDPATGPSG
jgi:hypothetical protein